MLSLLLALCAVGPAGSVTPYQLSPAIDGVAGAGLLLTFGASALFREEEPFASSCAREGEGRCDPDDLLGFDRYAVGKDSDTWTLVSDIGEISATLLPFVFDAVDVFTSETPRPLADWGTDAVVILEAEVLATTVSNLIKISSDRPRPRQYDPELYRAAAQSEQSFPCGHCVAITSGASAYAATYWLRYPDRPSRFVVAAVAGAASGFFSWSRVEAGAHFPSDALAGVGIGLITGVLVPLFHVTESSAVPALGVSGDGSALFSWRF